MFNAAAALDETARLTAQRDACHRLATAVGDLSGKLYAWADELPAGTADEIYVALGAMQDTALELGRTLHRKADAIR